MKIERPPWLGLLRSKTRERRLKQGSVTIFVTFDLKKFVWSVLVGSNKNSPYLNITRKKKVAGN